MTIGQRMKARRKELNMSADDLAAKLFKDRSTIYRYEKGDIENLPIDLLKPIADALDMTPSALMGWDQEQIDAISEMTQDANEYDDQLENEFKDLFDDYNETRLNHADIEKLRAYMRDTKKRNTCDHLLQLDLTDSELEEVFRYANYLVNTRK